MRLRKVIERIDHRISWLGLKIETFTDKNTTAYHYIVGEKKALEIAREIVRKEDERKAIERMEYAD